MAGEVDEGGEVGDREGVSWDNGERVGGAWGEGAEEGGSEALGGVAVGGRDGVEDPEDFFAAKLWR